MKKIIPRIVIVLVLIGLVGGGYWLYTQNPQLFDPLTDALGGQRDDGRLAASGFIESTQVKVAAEMGGTIESITVDKGDDIDIGDTLVQLDTALLDAQVEQANAQIELAQAQLAQIEAGVPPETIAIAQANVALAKAEAAAAYEAWQDAILVRNTPQELDMQIDLTASQLKVIELQMQQVMSMVQALEMAESLGQKYWEETQKEHKFTVTIPNYGTKSFTYRFKEGEQQQASVQWNLASTDVWQGWVTYENLQTAYDATLNTLATLRQLRADPIEAQARVTQTEATYQAKEAAVAVAQANLDLAQTGASTEQVEILQAQVSQTEAKLNSLQTQRQKFTLKASVAGRVIDKVLHEGEIALPGSTLLTVADPNELTLTVYVSAGEYGQISLNQSVQVYVDSFPDRAFPGTVSYISDQAEFTPKNVQTKEERVSTVYAIKILLENPDDILKAGMPADAVFDE